MWCKTSTRSQTNINLQSSRSDAPRCLFLSVEELFTDQAGNSEAGARGPAFTLTALISGGMITSSI